MKNWLRFNRDIIFLFDFERFQHPLLAFNDGIYLVTGCDFTTGRTGRSSVGWLVRSLGQALKKWKYSSFVKNYHHYICVCDFFHPNILTHRELLNNRRVKISFLRMSISDIPILNFISQTGAYTGRPINRRAIKMMIITTTTGEKIDTDSLSSEERHILQKLFAWKSLVDSVALFREKKKEALKNGWNNSGPVSESRALSLVIAHLETQVRLRLQKTT